MISKNSRPIHISRGYSPPSRSTLHRHKKNLSAYCQSTGYPILKKENISYQLEESNMSHSRQSDHLNASPNEMEQKIMSMITQANPDDQNNQKGPSPQRHLA